MLFKINADAVIDADSEKDAYKKLGEYLSNKFSHSHSVEPVIVSGKIKILPLNNLCRDCALRKTIKSL